MLTGIHFLLTYACNFKCDSCFLYCGPEAQGTFTISALRKVFDEIEKTGTIEWTYFEGGEAFLFYPLLVEGIRLSRTMGLKTGIVTNSYWATSIEDAELWLKPLCELGIADLSVSDDAFHYGEEKDNPAKSALEAARRLGMPVGSICIEGPQAEAGAASETDKGAPVIGGNVKFRGRAVEKLTEGLPTRPWQELNKCPYEDLEDPKRVHVDPGGNVHVCQGLSMGNMWETPLSTLVKKYDARSHPVCGPLLKGGPALLAEEYNLEREDGYVDECHFCYLVRMALIERFPQYLAPRQVYGLE
jgi:MoaA/NifB/PqqE/SkfB family radical SAM enzyme